MSAASPSPDLSIDEIPRAIMAQQLARAEWLDEREANAEREEAEAEAAAEREEAEQIAAAAAARAKAAADAEEAQRIADEAEAAEAAEAAKRELIEDEARARAEGHCGPTVLDGEPPDWLVVDTGDHPPQRARLVRFVAWQAWTHAEIERLERTRQEFLASKLAPGATAAKLRELIESDQSAYLAYLRRGDLAAPEPVSRSEERAMLEAQLAADTHKAEIVLAAFDELECEIRWRQAEAAGLAKRHHHFLNAALRERASLDLAAVYSGQKVALERTIASLLGLDVVTGGRSALREIAVQLPRFNVAGTPGDRGRQVWTDDSDGRITVTHQEQIDAAAPWRDLATAWTLDPAATNELDSKEPPCPSSTAFAPPASAAR